MDHFAGLDVSVKETSVCIVDDTGKIVREVKVASEPNALLAVLKNPAYHFKRIGLEAGPLSQWLCSALAEAELPVVCVETRHMQAVLKAQINKTDRNDARGIAQMMRVGLYRPVHVKTLRSQKLRMLLTHRKLLQSKAIAIENDLRGTLRNFGLKVGMVGKAKFEARIKELVENLPDLAILIEPLLIVRRALRERLRRFESYLPHQHFQGLSSSAPLSRPLGCFCVRSMSTLRTWKRSARCVSPSRYFHRPDSSWGKAGRSSGADVGQVRVDCESQDREGYGLEDPRVIPCARRQSDRIRRARAACLARSGRARSRSCPSSLLVIDETRPS